MQKLFAVSLGGRALGCNTELHDVVFVVGKNFEDTYPQLIKKWFGIQKRLHIDAYIEVNHVDGYDISLRLEKPIEPQKNRLFFVNFGAYQKDYFGEIHHTQFYVAASKTEALMRAKNELCKALVEPHCDDNLLVDDIFKIEKLKDQNIEYYIHFNENTLAKGSTLKIINIYQRLDLPEMLLESAC